MNRSFTARLSRNTPPRLRDYLWATHRLFNESLAYDQSRDREGAVSPCRPGSTFHLARSQ